MKLKKRIFSFLAVLAVSGLAILMCTACMSAEEKEKAKGDIREAKPVAEKYLEDNFGGGQVVSIEFMQAKKNPGPVPDFNKYASGFCKADVRLENGTEFQLIVDTDNKICYDNLNADKVINEAVQTIVSLTDGTKPDDIEVNVAVRGLLGAVGSGYEGFLSRDTDTAEKLLNGDYYFNVVLKYGSSVNGVDVSRLENTPYKASITVRLIQLSQFAESGTKTDLLGSSDCNLTLNNSLTYLYLRENLFLDNFRMSDDENFTRFQKGNMVTYLQNKVDDKCVRVYLLHPLFQVDDLILAWDSSVADLSVSSVPAEKQISTEYYSGQKFTALCDTAAKIDYVIKTESRYSKVYAFTTGNFNDMPYLAGNGGGKGKDVADCMMLISGTDYHSADFNIKGAGSITVGLYKR